MTSTTATRAPDEARARPWGRAGQPLLAIAFWVAVWQIAAWSVGQDFLLASPTQVLARLGELLPTLEFWTIVATSLSRIAIGFVAAAVIGSLAAAAAASFRVVDVLLAPLIATIRSAPVVSFIILVLLWTDSSRLSVVTSLLMVLPIMYANVLEGIRNRSVPLLEASSVFRVTPLRRIVAVDLPAILPFFGAACRSGVGLAWKSGVAAEVIGLAHGSIGEQLYEAKIFLDSAGVFAWTIVIVALSVACEALVLWLLRRAQARLAGGAA